jgi:hypothetical protein
MSMVIKVGRRRLKVPREVEAAGGAAMDRWVAAQTKPTTSKSKSRSRKPRARAKAAPAPQVSLTPEGES